MASARFQATRRVEEMPPPTPFEDDFACFQARLDWWVAEWTAGRVRDEQIGAILQDLAGAWRPERWREKAAR